MAGPRRLRHLVARRHLHHLHQVIGRQRTLGGDEAGVVLQGGLCGGLADLHRGLEILGPSAPDAAMAAAALDHRHARAGHQAQHLGRLRPHVLCPRMAGEMDTDAALERLQARRQPVLLGDVHDVFGEVERGVRQPFDGRIPGTDQLPFELEHQRAGRRQRNDVVALVDPRQQGGRNFLRRGSDRRDVSEFQLRHAAAGRMHDLGFDAIPGQHGTCGGADIGAVEVHEAGRIEHRLALAEGRRGLVEHGPFAARPNLESLARIARQASAVVDPGQALHAAARGRIVLVGRPVRGRGEE